MTKNTYRVLVADDEYWSRESMRHMIPWETYAMEFLEPACDGEEALRRLNEEKVDILFTDINMPFVNGLELLKEIQLNHSDIVTVAISVYDDFDKVKGVFMAGGINYLLKPINKVDVINILSKALEIIGERKATQLKEEKYLLEMKKVTSSLQDNEFSSMLVSKLYSDDASFPMISNINLTRCSMILIKIHDIRAVSEYYQNDILLMSYSIKKQLREVFEDKECIMFNYSYHINEFLIVVDMDSCEIENMTKKLISLFQVEETGPVSIISYTNSCTLDNIHIAYREMLAKLVTRPFNKRHIVMHCNNISPIDATLQERFGNRQEEEMKRLLSKGNRSALKTLIFETSGLAHCEDYGWSYLEVKQVVCRVLDIIIDSAKSVMSKKDIHNMDTLNDVIEHSVDTLNLATVLNGIEAVLYSIPDNHSYEAPDSILYAVHQSYEYINKEFCENLTVSSLSKMFKVNPGYFARLFRREYGDNPTVYITKKRMEKAKQLMKHLDLNLTEISFMVGYDDYTYFCRVFRRLTDQSPSEYRKMLTSSHDNDFQ